MAVFEALADPTRRRILELLAGGERSAGDIAAEFAISRPGVSRHLRVLRESGLVQARGEGQRRLYSVDPAPLEEVQAWLTRYRGFWAQRLDALETEVRRARRDRGSAAGPAAGSSGAPGADRAGGSGAAVRAAGAAGRGAAGAAVARRASRPAAAPVSQSDGRGGDRPARGTGETE